MEAYTAKKKLINCIIQFDAATDLPGRWYDTTHGSPGEIKKGILKIPKEK
jgi:hypothetical protein